MFLKLGEHFNGGRGELFHLKGMTPWGQKSREGLMAPTRSNSPIWYFSENIAKITLKMTNTINFFVATHFCKKLKWASRGPGNKKQWACISWVQHGAKPRAPYISC